MAIKLCGLSVMEPKLFAEPHTTFTGYDRSLQERQIENWGRGVIFGWMVLCVCVCGGEILWHSPLDWSMVSTLSKIARGLKGRECVCAVRGGWFRLMLKYVSSNPLFLSPLHGQPKFSPALLPFILQNPPPHTQPPPPPPLLSPF